MNRSSQDKPVGCGGWIWVGILFFVAIGSPSIWTWGLFLLFLFAAIASANGQQNNVGGKTAGLGGAGVEVVTLSLESRPAFDRDARALGRLLADPNPPRVRLIWNYRTDLLREEGVLEEVAFKRMPPRHGLARRYKVAEPRVLLSKQHASPVSTMVTLAPGAILIGDAISAPVEVRYWDDLTAEIHQALVRLPQSQTPQGAEVVGTSWLHVRVDGSPDRRFADNPRANVIRYTDVRLMASVVDVLYLRFLSRGEADRFLSTIRVREARSKPRDRPQQARSSASPPPRDPAREHQRQPPPRPEPARPRSPHEVLGVPFGADQGTIRKAYIELVKQYHPDRVANLAPEIKELAGRRMREINQAYEAIGGT